MRHTFRRSKFIATGSGFAAVNIVRAPARAAEFVYKFGDANPVDYPAHVRMAQMSAAVKRETNGRLEIQTFPNGVLGSQTSMMSQLRLGSIQFMNNGNSVWSSVVPAAALDSVGFAFLNTAQALAAMDGAVGAYIRKEFLAKGLFVFDKTMNFGFRQVTSSTHPIQTADDFRNFKLRTPPAAIFVDLFRTLGASPVPLDANELYTALQTHVVDGQETPLEIIEVYRLYEVQKYLSITNHIWTGAWVVANGDAWNALPPDIQAVVTRNMQKYILQERNDIRLLDVSTADKLRRQGFTFNTADAASMRRRLTPYYTKWKGEFGATAWSLLEAVTGKLA